MFCYCLLALIIVHYIHIGQLMQALAGLLVMRMHNFKTDVAYVRQYPYPAF